MLGSDRRETVAMFLAVTLLFGSSFPAIEVGLVFFPPLLLAVVRYSISAVLLLAYARVTTDYWRPRTARDWLAVLAGGALFIGSTGLTFIGQQFTTGGVAAIIVSLAPVLTVLFGWVLLPAERLSRRGVLGVAVGFCGVTIVVGPSPDAVLDPAVVGKLLIVLSTVSVSLGTVLVRRADAEMPVPALTGWAMVLGATIQSGFSVATGESLAAVRLTPLSIATMGYLGALVGALAFVLYFSLLDRVGPLEASLMTYLTPIVALVVGWWLLDEAIQPVAILGFVVIAAGFGLLKNRELAAELARYRGAAR